MTIKEKIVRQAITKVRKKIEQVKFLLSANPLGRICEIRIEAQKILEKHGNDNATILELLKPLAAEEKKMFLLEEKQKNTIWLIEKQVALEHELSELGRELYSIERRRS